jgi:hypothetical protein
MKKKSDLDNIFESYVKGVVLNEAPVKPVEVAGTNTPLTSDEIAFRDRAKANGKNLNDAQVRIMYARQKELDAQNGTNYAAGQTTAAQPTVQSGQSRPQSQLGGTIGSVSNSIGNVGNTLNTQSSTTTQTTPQIDNQVTSQRVVSSQPVAASDEQFLGNQPYPEDSEADEFLGNQTSTMEPVAASDEEFGQDEEHESDDETHDDETHDDETHDDEDKYNDEEENNEEKGCGKKTMKENNIMDFEEKKMIAKFLKQLSEKNYASSHKYLKTILNHKVNKALMGGIERI